MADHARACSGFVPEQAITAVRDSRVNEAKGISIRQCGAIPVASMLCDTYTIVHGIHAPNVRPLMDKIVAAFRKVFGDLTLSCVMRMTRFIPVETVGFTVLLDLFISGVYGRAVKHRPM